MTLDYGNNFASLKWDDEKTPVNTSMWPGSVKFGEERIAQAIANTLLSKQGISLWTFVNEV